MNEKFVKVKEHSTRIQGAPYTFALMVSVLSVRVVITDHTGKPVPFETVEKDDTRGQHIRETLSIFLTGKK